MESNSTANTLYIIPDEEVSAFAKGLLKSLSPAAAKLAVQIGDELHMNNALWYFDHENNRSAINGLRELKERKVLWSAGDKMYFINPLCIRRGNAVTVAEKTKEIVLDNRGVDKSLLIPLNSKMVARAASPFVIAQQSRMDITPVIK